MAQDDTDDTGEPIDHEREEAEDRAFVARQKARHEANAAAINAREGVVLLSDRPRMERITSVKRSIPGSRDAHRLVDLVIEGLGERCELDLWSASFERCLLLREEGQPGWYLPQRLLTMVDEPMPSHSGGLGFFNMHIPERIKRRQARMTAWEAEEAEEAPPKPEPEPTPLALAPGGSPGRLRLHEGAAYLEIVYDERGAIKETCSTMGDSHGYGDWRTEPFALDTLARPPQVPPISLLLDPSLQPEGIPLAELAQLVCASDLAGRNAGRVYMPCPQPGTVTGSWARGLRSLKEAEWRGEIGPEGGYVVIDAWNGTALVVGADRPTAFEAWQEEIRAVQPLPPVPPPVVERPEPEPEPEPEPIHPPAPPADNETTIVSSGVIEFTWVPPVDIPWPAPRPENVAAVALPLPALPPVPSILREIGFTRALRLFGEQGQVGFTFMCEMPDGLLFIGDDALAAIDLERLFPEMYRIAAEVLESSRSFPRGSPADDPQYPITVHTYRVWDWLGRAPELAGAGTSWGEAFSFPALGPEARHQVIRVQRRAPLDP